MKLSTGLIALGLCLGVAAPALAQPGYENGRHDRGPHGGMNDGRHGMRDHRRRVCRMERHHGHRVQRCFYR